VWHVSILKKKNLISCLFPDHVGDNPSTRDSWSISSLKKKLLKLVGSKVPHALRKLVNLSGYRSRHHMINVIFSLHTGRQTIWVMHGKYWYITNLAIDVSWCTYESGCWQFLYKLYCIHNWHIIIIIIIIIKTRTDQKDGARARSNSRIILHPFHDLNVLSLAPWVTCHVAIYIAACAWPVMVNGIVCMMLVWQYCPVMRM